MDPLNCLNNVMNRVDHWSQPTQGFCSRHVKTRVATVLAGAPLGVAATAQEAILGTVQCAGAVLKLGVRTLRCISSSECLKNLDEKLPSLKDFFATVGRVIAQALGVFASATLGFISPSANFRLQVALGNVISDRSDALQATLEETQRLKQEVEDKQKAILAQKEADAAKIQLAETCESVLSKAHEIETTTNNSAEPVSEQVNKLFSNAEAETQVAVEVLKDSENKANAEVVVADVVISGPADDIAAVEAELQKEIDAEVATETSGKVCGLGKAILGGLSKAASLGVDTVKFVVTIPVKIVTVPYHFFTKKTETVQA